MDHKSKSGGSAQKIEINDVFITMAAIGLIYFIISLIYIYYPYENELIKIPEVIKLVLKRGAYLGPATMVLSIALINIKQLTVFLLRAIQKGFTWLLKLIGKSILALWHIKKEKPRSQKKTLDGLQNTLPHENKSLALKEPENKPGFFSRITTEEPQQEQSTFTQTKRPVSLKKVDYTPINRCFEKYELDFVKVMYHQEGPAITRYVLDIGPGRVSQLKKVEKELAMTLEVEDVIITPSAEGVRFDVPNKKIKIVPYEDVKMEFDGVAHEHVLEIPLGRTAVGELQVLNVADCPHVLIAGATGSGKSVCINTIICSYLIKFAPEELKLILIDPKRVELAPFGGVPHLMMPIVVDVKKAAGALNYVVNEMDTRYKHFEQVGVRNITGHNKKVAENDKLPYIIVVIDELADLMIQVQDQVEESITRIGQLARAAGIHLIIGTQRPSVDVISGVIKSNILGRIAFSTASTTDSRVILDQGGAEKLLGKGDGLLFTTSCRTPERFQGAYMSDEDVEEIVEWTKSQYEKSELIEPEEIEIPKKEEQQIIDNCCSLEGINSQSQETIKLSPDDRLMKYLCEVTIEFGKDNEPILLPGLSEIRERLKMGKPTLNELIKKFEKEEFIISEGNSRSLKRYVTLSLKEAKCLLGDL